MLKDFKRVAHNTKQMPSGNTPGVWKDANTLKIARIFGVDDPRCFSRNLRSYHNKITHDDVYWLVTQTYWDCPKCLKLVNLFFYEHVLGCTYSLLVHEESEWEE